jgi:hypothetical protein
VVDLAGGRDLERVGAVGTRHPARVVKHNQALGLSMCVVLELIKLNKESNFKLKAIILLNN